MKDFGYYNGTFGPIEEITVPLSDRTHWFGDGVYDATIARNKRILFIDEHIDRFFNSARLLDITIGETKEEVADLLNDLVARFGSDEELFVYWQVTRGYTQPHRLHDYEPGVPGNIMAFIRSSEPVDMTKNYKLVTRPDTRFLHCNIKTLNLIPAVMSAHAAAEADCDETVLHRDGIVTEAGHSNVHIVKDNVLITHPADNLILPGIARAHLIRACKQLGYTVEEREYTLDELFDADEVLFTSSSSPCMRAESVDGKPVRLGCTEMIRRLQDYLGREVVEYCAPER